MKDFPRKNFETYLFASIFTLAIQNEKNSPSINHKDIKPGSNIDQQIYSALSKISEVLEERLDFIEDDNLREISEEEASNFNFFAETYEMLEEDQVEEFLSNYDPYTSTNLEEIFADLDS